MPWDTDDVPAAELLLLAQDYPIVLANQAAEEPFAALWSNGTGVVTDTDRSEPGYEAWYLHDRSCHRRSRPNAEDTEWWVVLNLQDDLVFDTIAILNHTIDQGPDHAVDVEMANNSGFSSGLQTIIATTTLEPSRHIFLDVGDDSDPQQIIGATFVRLHMTFSSPFRPEIGEIWLGRRRQLRAPARPFDHLRQRGEMRMSGPPGARDLHEGHAGGLLLELSTRDVGDETLRGIVADSRSGTEPMLAIPRPLTAPHRGAVMIAAEQAIRVATVADPDYHELQGFNLIESAPFLGAA